MPKIARKKTRQSSNRDGRCEKPTRSLRTRPSPEPLSKTPQRRKPKTPALPLYTRTQDDVKADPNQQIRLFSLPREIVQDIAGTLPLASSVCLTLTCKHALETVGTWPWRDIKKEDRWSPSRGELFKLLTRDWGTDIWDFCVRCNTLHPPLPPPRNHRKTKLTAYCFGQDAMIDYLPQDNTHGYNPVFPHIISALEQSQNHAAKKVSGPAIALLSADFTISKPHFTWRLVSSGRRIDGNLVVEHVHTFQPTSQQGLQATHLLALPIRLCPHQSTTTTKPAEPSMHIKSIETNSPQLTHAINSAFPATQRARVNMAAFKLPSPQERETMDAADRGEDVVWRCRSCPTQYSVAFSGGRLVVTSWHCFGRDLLHAARYWKLFVRRTGKTLGREKRNDEWWSKGKAGVCFEVDG
jgi:hypothetical protein